MKNFDEICSKQATICTCDNLKILGKNIKKIREENKLTQSDVAFYIFSDKSLISALERGVYKNITLFTVVKLMMLFGTNIEDLFNAN